MKVPWRTVLKYFNERDVFLFICKKSCWSTTIKELKVCWKKNHILGDWK